jgi:hypothetical protein
MGAKMGAKTGTSLMGMPWVGGLLILQRCLSFLGCPYGRGVSPMVECQTSSGEVAEWSIASDLKSDEPKGSVSSNLTLSVLSYIGWLGGALSHLVSLLSFWKSSCEDCDLECQLIA